MVCKEASGVPRRIAAKYAPAVPHAAQGSSYPPAPVVDRKIQAGAVRAPALAAGVSVEVIYSAKCRVLRRLRQELAGLLD